MFLLNFFSELFVVVYWLLLFYDVWCDICVMLYLWMQIVGKIWCILSLWVNYLWYVVLYFMVCGLMIMFIFYGG